MTISRRNLLASTISTIGLLGASSAFGRVQDVCMQTPAQPEGPFYPVRNQFDKNNDLTLVEGRRSRALGQTIYLQGIVTGTDCAPVKNAVVEIWQACASGRYNHPGDEANQHPLDPNFQYWGIASTDAHGVYNFKTIIPGHYSAGENWMRPPHIHFKVHKLGYHELTTQMYFAGNQYNDGDLILRRLSETEKNAVVVTLIPKEGAAKNEFDCTFNLSLTAVV